MVTTVTGERTYVIGLPVVITVKPDGTVTAEVDLSEASDLWDAATPAGQDFSDAVLQADAAVVESAVSARKVVVS